ncbi:MAG: nucleotidyltransferase family protein [Betaproteobacteria bacterium]|nr:nucleotidyltransferase family protein [Betaproteobacteria bacterium]
MSIGNPECVISAILRGEASVWAGGADPAAVTRFLEAGRRHGVLPLLAEEFLCRKDLGTWPEEVHLACREVTRAQTMYELTQCAEVLSVLNALADAGLRPLLLKGTGLAYGLYSSPILRPRSDSDLLVSTEQVARRGAGHATGPWLPARQRARGAPGRLSGGSAQESAGRHHLLRGPALAHDNYQRFACLFDFDDLAATSVPVPALGPHARRLGNVQALILALIHRAGNNRNEGRGAGDKLIWLYDIYLLVKEMTDAELERFRDLVESRRIVAIALEGLRRCADFFGSPRLTSLIRELESGPFADSGLDWLRAGRLRFEWMELRAPHRCRPTDLSRWPPVSRCGLHAGDLSGAAGGRSRSCMCGGCLEGLGRRVVGRRWGQRFNPMRSDNGVTLCESTR